MGIIVGCNSHYSGSYVIVDDIENDSTRWWTLRYVCTTKDNIAILTGRRFTENQYQNFRYAPTIYYPEIIGVDIKKYSIPRDIKMGDGVYLNHKTKSIELDNIAFTLEIE
jgi:hypothetical protein